MEQINNITNNAKTLPYNIESENIILGSMLQDHECIIQGFDSLSAEDFYDPFNNKIFLAMEYLYKNRMEIDPQTVINQVSKSVNNPVEDIRNYIYSLVDNVSTTVIFKAHIRAVTECSVLRKLINSCTAISNLCYDQDLPFSEILEHAQKSIYDIALKNSNNNELQSISSVLSKTISEINELSKLQGKLSGVPTGIHDLDRALTGLHGKELILIGARPSMGKTAVAMNFALYAATHANKKTAIFSLEMPATQIAMRLLCSNASVSLQRIREGTLTKKDWQSLAKSAASLHNAPIFIDDSGSLTIPELKGKCRKLKLEQGGLDLIVIDYLQLLHSGRRTENRQTEVSEISRELKSMSMELDVPIIACSQLSRRVAINKDSHRPQLSDLRESGAIEQDADVVILIHRETYYQEKEKATDESGNPIVDNSGEFIIAKQRNGPTTTIDVEWQQEYVRYTNLDNTIVAQFK